jgi:hypothetical protein
LQGRGGFDEEDLVADLLGDVIETDHGGLKEEIVGRCLGHKAALWKRFPTADLFNPRVYLSDKYNLIPPRALASAPEMKPV